MTQNQNDSTPLPPWLWRGLRELPPKEREESAEAWASAAQLADDEPPDDELRRWGAEVWEVVNRETLAESRPSGLRLVGSRQLRWLAAAAGFALLVAAGASLWLRPQSVTAPLGESTEVSLSDGSVAELNAGSRLTYPRRFGGSTRHVRLEGEAYFVIRPSNAAFIVETFNATVTVLGTTFNVRAWPEERAARTEVTLESGRVRLASRDGENAVELGSGEYSLVQGVSEVPEPPISVQVSTAVAWRERGFVLVDRPLSVVLSEMQRRFAVQIAVQRPEMLDEMLSVVATSPANADTILQDISQYLGFTVTRTAEGFVLRSP